MENEGGIVTHCMKETWMVVFIVYDELSVDIIDHREFFHNFVNWMMLNFPVGNKE
jgi:hypothetical protein